MIRQWIHRTFNATLILFLTTMAFITACEKDHGSGRPEHEQMLVIDFSQSTISNQLVDSAFLTLTREGTTSPYFQRFDVKDNKLVVSIESLNQGKWIAEMFIYARSGKDNKTRYYERKASFTKSAASTDVSYQAPDGTFTDKWKPRVLLTESSHSLTLLVALDNTDPFFQIVAKDSKWDRFEVERSALNRTNIGNELMASHKWMCTGTCFTSDRNVIDSTSFLPFTEKVRSKVWNNGEVSAIIKDTESGEEREFFFIYTK